MAAKNSFMLFDNKPKNKENMKIVVDFLKRANLYGYWKQYVISNCDKYESHHWSSCIITDIFGRTVFTLTIYKHKNNNEKRFVESIYILFIIFLKLEYPEIFEKVYSHFSFFTRSKIDNIILKNTLNEYIKIDEESKKIHLKLNDNTWS